MDSAFASQAVHAFEFQGVVGDEYEIKREGLAAKLQILGADFRAGFLKLKTDFRSFHCGVPIEGQQVERLEKGGDFSPLALEVVATEHPCEQLENAQHGYGAILGTVRGKHLDDFGIGGCWPSPRRCEL